MSESLAEHLDATQAARGGIVDIRVVPTSADCRVAARADPYRHYYELLTVLARLGAGAVFAGFTATFLWLMQPVDDPITFLSIALAACVVGIALFRFAVEHQWKRRLARHRAERSDPYRLTGDGRSLSVEDEHSLVRLDLNGLHRLVETPSHLIIYHRHAPVLALPRLAFPEPETAAAFADFLLSRIDPSLVKRSS